MSEMRVYEAASKLNMSVGEVIGLLTEKGVEVKSPIAVITQAQFDEILDSFTREPSAGPAKTAEPEEPVTEAPVEKERGRLTLVTPITAAKQAQEPQAVREADEDEDIPTATAEPAGKTEPVPPARAPVGEAQSGKGSDFTKKIAYTAAGLSVFALLVTIVLSIAALRNANEVGALSSTVSTNQSAINDTRNSLSDLKSRVAQNQRLQVRAGLSERSVTLDEIAVTMPGPRGERLRKLAESLNSLTSGM